MLGRFAMSAIVADAREPGHGPRVAWSSPDPVGPILGAERFRRGSPGYGSDGEVKHTMMFVILLVPVVLLGVLLGMDRLERWTVAEREDTTSPS